MAFPGPWNHLRRLLLELGQIQPIETSNPEWLSIQPTDVLALIEKDDPSWQAMVPTRVGEIIKANGFFRNKSTG
jgi:hypothetical protein